MKKILKRLAELLVDTKGEYYYRENGITEKEGEYDKDVIVKIVEKALKNRVYNFDIYIRFYLPIKYYSGYTETVHIWKFDDKNKFNFVIWKMKHLFDNEGWYCNIPLDGKTKAKKLNDREIEEYEIHRLVEKI